MNKRILSLVLALVMVLGTFAVVSAEEAKVENMTQANKIQWLIDNKIVEGHKVNKDGEEADLDLDGNLTREQATKLLVYVIGKQDLAETLKGSLKLFKDVDLSRWSNGWINVAATHKESVKGETIVKGYPDGTFGPERNVTYAELATMLVRIVKNDMLGKDEINFAGANWATQYMRWAAEEGILDGVKVVDSNAPASRRDAFEMIFNAKYRYRTDNNVSFGDKMGIVSKFASGKIEINQDPKMTYNITYNTNFTDKTSVLNLAQNAVKPGSLVRLITDSDNNVLYLIELGSPVDGHYADRWATVADKQISAMSNLAPEANRGTAKFIAGNSIAFTKGKDTTNVKLMSNTKYFVADVDNNFLKEVKSFTEAMNYVGYNGTNWYNETIENVYAGYNTTAWGNEAKVVVFNKTHLFNGDSNLLRVVTPGVNSHHNVALENTKGEVINRNTANWFPTNWFPGNWTFDFMDVVSFKTVKESNNVYTKPVKVIDYSTFNVYEVISYNKGNRTLTLRDEFNRRETYVVNPSVAEFLEGQTVAGRHVQVAFNADNNIKVISNVDLALRGALTTGVNPDLTKTVKLDKVYTDKGSNYVVVRDFHGNGVYGASRTYKLMGEEQYNDLRKTLAETKVDVILDITLSVNDNGYQTPVVVDYVIKPAESTVAMIGNTQYDSLKAAINAAKSGDTILVFDGYYKEELTIDKAITLKSVNGRESTEIAGRITITADDVTVEGFTVTAPAGYKEYPVIYMINLKNVNILNNTVVADDTAVSAIGTWDGPAKVTGKISGNTVTGMIMVGTDGAVEVSNNNVTLTTASTEGICFYPVGSTAEITVKGNTVGPVTGDNVHIKVNEKPTSVNGKTNEVDMLAVITADNNGATSKLTWFK